MNQVQVLESPIKSEGDKKDYRLIKLPNGLKALLSHFNAEENSESDDIAAIMLVVKFGSFDDPRKAMGMAHFLEHILFMGSEKYPGENSFSEFLAANGGSDNAMTSSEYTGYYFNISENVFSKALDIFANQFISPRLSKNAMQREREAVDSEYQMALSNDGILFQSVIKCLMNENHPASQFDCGNLKTLKEDITDDDLHSELLKFFKKYGGNKMVLAVQSKQTLDEMQDLIVECFSAIKSESSGSSLPSMTVDEIFKPEFFSNMVYMKPKTVTKSLNITWALPSMQKHYKCSPMRYLSKIFDNYGDGGLIANLKQKQFITNLSFYGASNSFGGSSQYTMPKLSITMTDQGAQKVDEILEAVFSYLLMIKQTPIEEHRRLYNYFKEQNDLNFKFHRETSASSNVTSNSRNMLLFDDVDILRGSSLLQQFDESIIQETVNMLNQRKFNLFILDANHGSFPKKEKFFGAEYDEISFPEKYQKLWDERKINSEFFLEKANPFIASNFDIFVNADESPVRLIDCSSLIE